MNIVVSGATGFLGQALLPALKNEGHKVARLVRQPSAAGSTDIFWNPAKGEIDAAALEGFDAAIHLAGENVAQRWTAAAKSRIIGSRASGTRLISTTLANLKRRPRVLLSAAGIGYYGSRGDEILTEESAPGQGFLADVASVWESATRPAAEAGIRVACTRFSTVLSPAGGALAMMLPAFRCGAGGRLGSGRQFMSWITLDDTVAAILFLLNNENMRGPVNVTSPHPVTNAEFTRALGSALRRPVILPMPAFILRLAMPGMADELLLSSLRIIPGKLSSAGFRFSHPDIESALREMLQKPK